MTESRMFSIFPDRHLASGRDLKETIPRSKKKALCDVKNTLLTRKPALNEPLTKLNLELQSEGACKQTAKELVKETSGKVESRQEGTFTIVCDDEDDISWDKCEECKQPEESFLAVRAPSDYLKEADIGNLAQGLLCLINEDPVQPSEQIAICFERMRNYDCFDIEMKVPMLSPPDLEPAIFCELSDEESINYCH